jgi:hypothetical protein
MQLGKIEFSKKKKSFFKIIKESLIVKSLIKNLKFYLEEGNFYLLGGFGQSHSHICN